MVQQTPTKPSIITVSKAATSLGLKPADLTNLINEYELTRTKNARGQWAITITDFHTLKTQLSGIKNSLVEKKKQAQHNHEGSVRELKKTLAANIKVDNRERTNKPAKTVMFIGPTNSGKTYHGLQELYRDFENNPTETHVYCGPLRLLAYEVYLKMVERYGADKVGFITGEEKINPTAKLLATTAEMAPMEGNSILIDEAHWLVDTERGHVWTRLLHSSIYNNLYVLTANEATPTIEQLTDQAWFTDKQIFERKTAIKYGGQINVTKVPPRTAIVCFSRKNVYAIASLLAKKGVKVGVLYGALPLEARKTQIDSYLTGKYDVMVVTDVIGHGINLPIDNVVFTETEKFDGEVVRDVHVWEGAQIAGRAGRFGLSDHGTVYTATGLDWFNADKDLVKDYVLAAGGKIATDLQVDYSYIKPKFADLNLGNTTPMEASKLLPALYQWQKKGFKVFSEHFCPAPLRVMQKNLEVVLNENRIPLNPWDKERIFGDEDYPNINVNVNELWQLSTGPFDSFLPTLPVIAKWLTEPDRGNSARLLNFYETEILPAVKSINKRDMPLELHMEWLEKTVRIIGELKMVMVMFGVERKNDLWLGELRNNIHLIDAEKQLTSAIIRKLTLNVKQSNIGVCSTCGKNTNPKHQYCDKCFAHSKR